MLISNKENLNDNLEFSIGEECESTYVYDGIVNIIKIINILINNP